MGIKRLQKSSYRVITEGDMRDVLSTHPDDCFDSVVCDPPYGLEFMGAGWDRGVPGQDFWYQILKAMKPGGYLLAFGGTRTSHRLACAIEDAGFEIRDSIIWIYGSGFPKSQDIGKAIDKAAGAKREVVGIDPEAGRRNKTTKSILGRSAEPEDGDYSVTAPATPEAQQWDGWGTALKPAHEPIIVARKPLSESTVAANVLKHGTGGLNIDGGRIGTGDLTGQRPSSTMVKTDGESSWEQEGILCDLCAKVVADKQKPRTRATKESSVRSRVGRTMKGKDRKNHVDTNKGDIGCFVGQPLVEHNENPNAGSNLNIAEYGKKPMAQSQKDSSSITSTETDSTIESKTCASCGGVITTDTTTKKGTTPRVGRWPSNIILQHHDDCTQAGMKKVKTGTTNSRKGTGLFAFGDHEKKTNPWVGEDGKEEVAAWECHPDCPVRLLDDQSGVTTSGAMKQEVPGYDGNGLFMQGRSGPSNQRADTGGASRFFYQAPGFQNGSCVLCGMPLGIKPVTVKGINTQEVVSCKLERSRSHASSVGQNSKTTSPTTEPTAPKSVLLREEEKIVQAVRFATDLCGSCEIVIAHALVVLRHNPGLGELPFPTYIEGFKRKILIPSLVQCADEWVSTDTIPTIASLSKLFGCVLPAIESYIKQESEGSRGSTESAPTRFRYVAKASLKERYFVCHQCNTVDNDRKAHKTPGWNPKEDGPDPHVQSIIFHPTQKPVGLIRYLIRLVTPPGGIVLDPFVGSGTLGVAAKAEGFNYLGIDNDPDYCRIARYRTSLKQI
jgi:hypothetical protein